ncbi:hypothetical protein GEMRC1_010994 [Eukaryota sp. GEM-RC1]
MVSVLTLLKEFTFVNIDSADLDELQYLKDNDMTPHDATTNPTLVMKAYHSSPRTKSIVDRIIDENHSESDMILVMDKILVEIGCEILKIIPGKVSTELDSRFSFSVRKTVEQGKRIMRMYEHNEIPRERVLLKVASTWEGIMAMKQLKENNILCNATLCFSLPQAICAARISQAYCVSPFVGRISDWYKKNHSAEELSKYSEDPAITNLKNIYWSLKKYGLRTQVMGASFRSAESCLQIAGCDMVTLNPAFIKELNKEGTLEPVLNPNEAMNKDIPDLKFDEESFRWNLNENVMATELLADGIRKFAADARKMENIVREKLSVAKIRDSVSVDELSSGIGYVM